MKPARTDANRGIRFLAAIFYFLLSGTVLAAFSSETSTAQRYQVFLVYAAYLLTQGTLLMLLSRRLYRQHQLRQLRFDIGSLMIVTTIVAIPMGTMIALRRITSADERQVGTAASIFLFFNLFVSLFPLVSCCEAITTWWQRIRKMRKDQNPITDK